MNWTVPGTVIQIQREDAQHIEDVFTSMFLGGGIMLGQVTAISGLEAYTVQNWVKRGLLSAPVQKRYSMRQLCRILNINMLKSVLPMEKICGMLGYINGQLDDESDDVIDDSKLYFLFVKLAANSRELFHQQDREEVLDSYLADYVEPVPGARQRVKNVMSVMLTAWLAARMRQEAEVMLTNMEGE
jgi:hypothetical protein